jgi:bifunctional oligoribonuclease and PAP phosphatase NrnA
VRRLSGYPFEPWFLDRIRSASHIALMTHVGPDADGLGSQVAFCAAARKAGVSAVVVNNDPLPNRYRWLDPQGVVLDVRSGGAELGRADLGLVFDTHDPARAGQPHAALTSNGVDVLVLDHHRVAEDADVQGVVATEFSSTGELCYRLLQALGWPIDAEVAHGIYSAISFDTGSFRYLRNQATTMRVAAELLDTGLDTNPIQEALFASRPAVETRLLGRILDRVRFAADGRVAFVIADADVAEGLQVASDAYGEAIPFVIGIEGVLAAAMLKPGRSADEWRLSLRSKTAAKIGHIAEKRGGGGHAHAAGATLQGKPDALMAEIVAEMTAAVVGAA